MSQKCEMTFMTLFSACFINLAFLMMKYHFDLVKYLKLKDEDVNSLLHGQKSFLLVVIV